MSFQLPPLNLSDAGTAASAAKGSSGPGRVTKNINVAAPGSNSGAVWVVGAVALAFLLWRK